MRPSRSPVLWFFAFAYAITGVGVCVIQLFLARRLPIMVWLPYASYITGTGPSLAGVLLVLWFYGLPGIRRLAFQLNPWSVGGAWPVLAVCLLLPLGAAVLTITVPAMLGVAAPAMASGGWKGYLYGAVIGEGLIGPGLFEELGWRGFALPHLQRRYSALASSLILGLVWAGWHFQNFIFLDPFPWTVVAIYVPTVMAYSVIFTWVYNSTGGSLFAAVVLHGAIDAQQNLFSWSDLQLSATPLWWLGLPYLVIAAGLAWRYGAKNLSWRDRIVAQPPGRV